MVSSRLFKMLVVAVALQASSLVISMEQNVINNLAADKAALASLIIKISEPASRTQYKAILSKLIGIRSNESGDALAHAYIDENFGGLTKLNADLAELNKQDKFSTRFVAGFGKVRNFGKTHQRKFAVAGLIGGTALAAFKVYKNGGVKVTASQALNAISSSRAASYIATSRPYSWVSSKFAAKVAAPIVAAGTVIASIVPSEIAAPTVASETVIDSAVPSIETVD